MKVYHLKKIASFWLYKELEAWEDMMTTGKKSPSEKLGGLRRWYGGTLLTELIQNIRYKGLWRTLDAYDIWQGTRWWCWYTQEVVTAGHHKSWVWPSLLSCWGYREFPHATCQFSSGQKRPIFLLSSNFIEFIYILFPHPYWKFSWINSVLFSLQSPFQTTSKRDLKLILPAFLPFCQHAIVKQLRPHTNMPLLVNINKNKS